jgi:hypothetical protein
MLLFGKALHAEAEPLMRRALAIVVASLGADHPNSQTVIGNYAALLGEMGLGEAEMRERFESLQRESLGQSADEDSSRST